jgi:hypothetical protein
MSGDGLAALLELDPSGAVPLKVVDKYVTRFDGDESLASLYADETEQRHRKDRGRSYVCDERLLVLAHTMHMDGMSARAVAREIFNECYSASPKALCNALLGAWHARGWEVRGRSEATALANVQRAFRPRCSHVSQASGRKRQRCERRCVGNDLTCWRHDPERIAQGVARVRLNDERTVA